MSQITSMSQITTHVLDTSRGKPAEGIRIRLQSAKEGGAWEDITSGITNADGRISQFMPEEQRIPPGMYRMLFETADYFKKLNTKAFYPYVPIVFETFDTEHYHVPLLLNPFGYSTYRGS